MTIAIAGLAALAILVIAVGIAMSGGGSGVNARLERYASSRQEKPATTSGQGGIAEALQSSQAMASLNKVVEQRDFGANLAREIARADLRLKVSEYLVIWAGCTVGIPIAMLLLSVAIKGLGHPIALLVGALVGFMIPRFWLNRRKSSRLLRQAAAGHDHADRQRAARRLLVPPGDRAGRPGVAAADLHRVRPRDPGGKPGPRLRHRPREHGPPREVGRPGADGDRHLDPAHRRRQPGRDPRLDRLHDPRAHPHRGRDPDPDRPAAAVGLRRRFPPIGSGVPVHRRAGLHVADVRRPRFWSPGGVLILCLGGFAMFIGFMLIRRINDIEVWPDCCP
jgi:hypothetical protein